MKMHPALHTRIGYWTRYFRGQHTLRTVSLLCLGLGYGELVAQSSGPAKPAAPASSDSDSEVVELSPFIVNTSQDLGYQATSTLAGTRLNTSIKDVGAAVSIYTKEFLEDINVAKLEDILTYTASTEGGGMNGNFSGMAPGAESNAEVRDDPSNSNRVRALAQATRTRDFFATDIPSDTYNFDNLTINRGPNAILAGVGNAGGIMDAAMRKATFKDNYRFVSRVSSYGSHREEVHLNKVVIPKRLAIRLDLLNDDQSFRQQPAYSLDQRLYAALQYRVFEPKRGSFFGRGTLRANFETGTIEGIPPDNTTPNSYMDNWFSPTNAPYAATNPGATYPENAKYYWDPSANSGQGAYYKADGSATITPGQTSGVYAGFPIFANWALVFADPRATTAKVDPTGSIAALNGVQGFVGSVPRSITTPGATNIGPGGVLRASGLAERNRPGYYREHLNDRNVFDFYNYLLTGELDFRRQRFNASDFRYEQLLWDGKAGLEFAYNDQSFTRYRNFAIANGNDEGIYIDVNKYLTIRDGTSTFPTGQAVPTGLIPNPNFGRPFLSTTDAFKDQQNKIDREAYQVTAFLKHDFTKGEGKAAWLLGNHTLSSLFFKTNIDRSNRTYVSTWDPFGGLNTSQLGVPGAFSSQVNAWFYIGDSLANVANLSDVRLQAITGGRPQYGDPYTMRVWDPATLKFVTGSTKPLRVLGKVVDQHEELSSTAFALQSNWFKNHVVTVVGWREDRDQNFTTGQPPYLPTGGLDESKLVFMPSAQEVKRSWTKSVVGLFPYRLPGNSELRAYWNEAGNFNPVGQRRNIWNEEVGSANATTREYGVMISAFNDKLFLRINRYRTQIQNDSIAIRNPYGYISTMITRMLTARDQGLVPFDWGYRYSSTVPVASITAVNNEWKTFEDVAKAFYATIPTRLRRGADVNFNPSFSGGPGTLQWNPDNIVNLTSINDTESYGTEFEATINPVRGWRVSLSASKNEAVRTDVAEEEILFARAWEQNLDTMFVNFGATAGTLGRLHNGSRQPGIIAGVVGKGDGNSFFQQYNGEVVALIKGQHALSGAPTPEIRKWRVNLVTRYEFQTGLLRGFSMGGAARWQDRISIGFPLTAVTDPELGNNIWISDKTNPYWGPSELAVDLSFGYKRKFKFGGAPIQWNIGLNIRNLNAKDELIPVGAQPDRNPDGSLNIALFRIPPERTVSITNSFSF